LKVVHGTELTVQCKVDSYLYGDYGYEDYQNDVAVETITCLDGELASPNLQCTDCKY